MKAVRIYEFGGSDRLQVEEVEDPQLEPGHVRIKVHACALNHVDVDIREGVSRFEINFPHILGLEVVGSIAELGPDVDGDWQVGERVMPYLLGGDVFIGVAGPGGFAEYIVAPTKQLVKIPDELNDSRRGRPPGGLRHRLAHALHPWPSLDRRDRDDQLGPLGHRVRRRAAGSSSCGAYAIGTPSSSPRSSTAQPPPLGMDAGIDYTQGGGARPRAKPPAGNGVDLVFEHVGGDLFQKGIESLSQDGRLVTCGAHSGEVVPFDIIPFFRSQQLDHRFVRVLTRGTRARLRARAPGGRSSPWSRRPSRSRETKAAMDTLEAREFFGKILVTP